LADSGSSLQPLWSRSDAAAHLGHHVAAELAEVELIDHDLRVGSRRGVQIPRHTPRAEGQLDRVVAELQCALT
jgi:hypothetical protein